MAELWDIYSAERIPLHRTAERGKPLNDGEYHVIVQIITVRPSDGRILITKRHPNKRFGNMWEFTGGSVQAGETSSRGAVRELAEETGILVGEHDLTYLRTHVGPHQFYDEYLVMTEIGREQLCLQKEEVCDARFVTPEELCAARAGHLLMESVFQSYLLCKKTIDRYLAERKGNRTDGI